MDSHNPSLSRISSQPAEGTKKRKAAKKKPDVRQPKPVPEIFDSFVPDTSQDLNSEMLQYTYGLEYKLADVKRKLKSQRRKFQSVIQNLALFLEAKGVSPLKIDDYITAISSKLAEKQANDEFGSVPSKRVHIEETAGGPSNINLVGEEKDVKDKSKKKSGTSNLIKINLTETVEPLQPQTNQQAASTSKSKKTANGTTSVAAIVIQTSPTDHQQQQFQPQTQPLSQQPPKKNSKKAKGSEKDKESKKKQADTNKAQAKSIQAQPTPIEENQSDEVQEIGYNPNSAKRMEPAKQYDEELLKNAGMFLPGTNTAFGNIDIQNLMKQYGAEQIANVFTNPASLPVPEQYMFGNLMGGFKPPQEIEQLLGGLGIMPNRNLQFPMNPNNPMPNKKP